jgi:hypothetical protein
MARSAPLVGAPSVDTKGVDRRIVKTVMSNAREYIANVDVYLFPNPKQSASAQMSVLVNAMRDSGVLTKNFLWIQVMGQQYWNSTCSSNQAWLQEALSTVDSLYRGCGMSTCAGIFTSPSDWSVIMCDSPQFSSRQLWWQSIDGFSTLTDFEPFGGWTKPNIKQYLGTTFLCNTAINKDVY